MVNKIVSSEIKRINEGTSSSSKLTSISSPIEKIIVEDDKIRNSEINSKQLEISLPLPSELSSEPPPPPPPSSLSTTVNEIVFSDIIGNFGWFQFIGSTAYDSVVTSIMLKPIDSFICSDNNEFSNKIENANSTNSIINQCYQSINGSYLLNSNNQMIKCNNWIFNSDSNNDDYKSTYLTIKWQLVCHNEWLIALIETVFFIGISIGNLIWGYLGDTFGRKKSYLISHLITLFAGICSLFITSYWPFAICRLIHGIGASGYFITYSFYSEVIGAKYRSNCSIIQHLGWGLFLMLIPVINKYSTNYVHLLAVSPIFALITLPIALWIPESSRWLMVKERYDEGKKVLFNIVKFNRINHENGDEEINYKLNLLEKQLRLEKTIRLANENKIEKNLYKFIFTNRKLVKDTIILCYLVFLGQFLYFLLTLNYYFIENLNINDNFLKSGIGEWIGIFTLLILMTRLNRRACFRIYLTLEILSFLFQYLIDSKILSQFNTRLVIVLNNGLGNLCAANILFLTLAVVLEVYPTIVRDTGKSIVCSALELGSTSSPMIIQLGRLIGQDKIDLMVAIMSSIALIASEFLTINDNIELSDT